MTPRMPLEERLKIAAKLLHRLPSTLSDDAILNFPEAIYDLYTRIIRPANRHKTLPPLDVEEKHALDTILKAFHCLPVDEQRIIWLKAEGMRWSVIGQWLGSSASLVHSRYRQALTRLRAALKGKS